MTLLLLDPAVVIGTAAACAIAALACAFLWPDDAPVPRETPARPSGLVRRLPRPRPFDGTEPAREYRGWE